MVKLLNFGALIAPVIAFNQLTALSFVKIARNDPDIACHINYGRLHRLGYQLGKRENGFCAGNNPDQMGFPLYIHPDTLSYAPECNPCSYFGRLFLLQSLRLPGRFFWILILFFRQIQRPMSVWRMPGRKID